MPSEIVRWLLPVAVLLCWNARPAEPAKSKVVEWLTPVEYDFGDVRFGRTVGTLFTFKNVSNDSILLQTVRTTCGCTAANWPEQPIAPGATGEIKIEYSADQSGGFRKKIRVFFDRQRKPEILWVQGDVN